MKANRELDSNTQMTQPRAGEAKHPPSRTIITAAGCKASLPTVTALIAVSAALGFGQSAAVAQCDPDPAPSGPNVSPSNEIDFSVKEYAYLHSSCILQSIRASELTAAGLFWNPTGQFGTGVPRAFGAFSSAVVVNNPDPSRSTQVEIEYFDAAGVSVGLSGPITIAANGSHIEDASMLGAAGIGSASIRVIGDPSNPSVLGSTLHYFDSIAVPGWGVVSDPDSTILPSGAPLEAPGEGSYQRLQPTPSQFGDNGGWHFAGPFRFTNTSVNDFDNGSAPVLMVANPNDHTVDVAFVSLLVGPNGTLANLGVNLHTLAPKGMVMETSLWTSLNQLTSSFAGLYDFDILVGVIALDGSQLVGDALVIDAFGDNEVPAQNRNLNLGRRLRMVSTSIAGSRNFDIAGELVASDVSTFRPNGGTTQMIRTGIKVANVGFEPTSAVTIEYFDHAGNPIGTDVIPGLMPFATLQIGLGEPQTPNFPPNMWNGSVRVRANCSTDRLTGWTAREIGKAPASWTKGQYRKAFGEELTSPANLIEPWRIASIVRTTPGSSPDYWPGYTSFSLNRETSNTGAYLYRFFAPSGSDTTNYAVQPFAGIRFGASSFTYEDSDPIGFLTTNNNNGIARIDMADTVSLVSGVNVLGDPFEEFNIELFARRGFGPISHYPGPVEPESDASGNGSDPKLP